MRCSLFECIVFLRERCFVVWLVCANEKKMNTVFFKWIASNWMNLSVGMCATLGVKRRYYLPAGKMDHRSNLLLLWNGPVPAGYWCAGNHGYYSLNYVYSFVNLLWSKFFIFSSNRYNFRIPLCQILDLLWIGHPENSCKHLASQRI